MPKCVFFPALEKSILHKTCRDREKRAVKKTPGTFVPWQYKCAGDCVVVVSSVLFYALAAAMSSAAIWAMVSKESGLACVSMMMYCTLSRVKSAKA